MYKLIFFCFLNIISLIHAAPTKNELKINDILQLDIFNKCPAILNNNIDVHTSQGGLSHCKNITLTNPPQQIEIINLNEFYCVGLLAADLQLCSGNKTNKLVKNYDDLKASIDKIKRESPKKICDDLKAVTLFNDLKNVTYLNKWLEILARNLRNDTICSGLCRDINDGVTNLFCSMIYYVSNNVSYTVIADVVQKNDVVTQTAEQKINTAPVTPPSALNSNTNTNVDNNKKIPNIIETPAVKPVVTAANDKQNDATVKTNANQPNQPIVNEQVKQKTSAPPVEIKPATTTTTTEIPVKNKDDSDTQVKTVPIAEQESKLPSTVNDVPVPAEEVPKMPSNIETSSVSSTVSGVRDDLGEDYFEEVDEINRENEDQLLPQTNSRKETIEILTNDQDRHRMPAEEGEDMEESNFFSYFMFVSVMFIAGYVVYHNKQKIMALVLEGRRDRNSRRRPNTASYRKLNSNLEEAVTSKCSGSASHVIY